MRNGSEFGAGKPTAATTVLDLVQNLGLNDVDYVIKYVLCTRMRGYYIYIYI